MFWFWGWFWCMGFSGGIQLLVRTRPTFHEQKGCLALNGPTSCCGSFTTHSSPPGFSGGGCIDLFIVGLATTLLANSIEMGEFARF